MEITPTEEQQAVIAAAKTSKNSLLVNALAGSAKTTTLVMAAHAMPLQTTFVGAFNKRIAEEMAKRMPSHIQCATMNSIGHRVWQNRVGHRLTVEADKGYNILQDLIKQLRPEDREYAGEGFASMLRAVRLAKSAGYVPKKFETIGEALCSQAEFEENALASADIEPNQLFWSLVDEALCLSIAQGFEGKIDFDDQIYLSTLFGGNYPKYSVVMIDEAQDLSPLNHRTLELMFGGRLIGVGDPRQAIYAFRGAHTSSMAEMKRTFDMDELTLSISFRCPKAAVRFQKRAPNMKWPEWAAEGKVETLKTWTPETPPDGSAVICRNNAPLFRTAMHFIRNSRGVKIVGNDIGAGLVRLLKKMGKLDDSRADVINAIGNWREEQIAKASPSRRAPIEDRAECLIVFAEQGENLREAIAFAEHLFAASGPVQFMTGHKAKGSEFDNVYHLDPFLIPSKWSRKMAEEGGDDSALQQERNLEYVITTRTKQNLYLVNSEDLL